MSRPEDEGLELDLTRAVPAELASGRKIAFRTTERGEELRVVAPNGEVEVSIELTRSGPVVKLRGARLDIESTESVALRCKRFELRTEDELQLHAGGDLRVGSDREVRVKSAEQTFIDGDYVNLNCLDRKGYHDEGVPYGSEEAEGVEAGPETNALGMGPSTPRGGEAARAGGSPPDADED